MRYFFRGRFYYCYLIWSIWIVRFHTLWRVKSEEWRAHVQMHSIRLNSIHKYSYFDYELKLMITDNCQ